MRSHALTSNSGRKNSAGRCGFSAQLKLHSSLSDTDHGEAAGFLISAVSTSTKGIAVARAASLLRPIICGFSQSPCAGGRSPPLQPMIINATAIITNAEHVLGIKATLFLLVRTDPTEPVRAVRQLISLQKKTSPPKRARLPDALRQNVSRNRS
jgi:hypothetical protein